MNTQTEQGCHIKSFIKWAGGKEREFEILKHYFPQNFSRYIEPFLGGGSVFFNTKANSYYLNDKSEELITLYLQISEQNKNFFTYLEKISSSWEFISQFATDNAKELIKLFHSDRRDIIDEFVNSNSKKLIQCEILPCETGHLFLAEIQTNLISKIQRAKKIEKSKGELPETDIVDNMECALKSSFYMYIRKLYNCSSLKENEPLYSAIFYFIREYCYSSMFRYNADGKFNVPYGGISYNKKNFYDKISYLQSKKLIERLHQGNYYCTDFEEFLNKIEPSTDDFIFLDPPYDSDFSTYAKNSFNKEDQIRLCEYLKKTKAKFLLVIKETVFIRELYKDFYVTSFDKHYLVSFKNRNKKDVTHLIITNYGEK